MRILIAILFFIISFTSIAQEEIDLVIWAGQSNALGRQGDATGYPEDVDNVDNQIRFNWNVIDINDSDGWITMDAQAGYFPDGHFGPEVTFSRNLTLAGYNTAIFKYTKGATSIFEHWGGPGEGGFYDSMVSDLNTAILILENEGHTVNVLGFVWIQGESDSNSQDAALAYHDNLNDIINDIRNNVVENSELPVILGVDEQFFNLEDQQQPEVLNAHQDIALNDENIRFTSMYGYPKADATHLTPTGLIAHGEGVYNVFHNLLMDENPTDNCVLSSSGDVVSILDSRSWGQSFTTNCSGELVSITFSAASNLGNSATFTLHNGADCSGTVLFSSELDDIVIGDNIVMPTDVVELDKEHSYYMNITSDTPTTWLIHYSNTDNVFGMLKTNRDGESDTSCRRPFPSFDLNFSVELRTSTVGILDETESINFYPNPTDGIVFIDLKGNKNVSAKVYNVLGKLVKHESNVTGELIINQESGVYFIEFVFENEIKQQYKLILK